MLKNYVAFDLETTGLSVETEGIIEIGALKVANGKVVDRFQCFVKPEHPISPKITAITGITNEMVSHAETMPSIIHHFIAFCEGEVLLGHNIGFDYKFIKKYATQSKLPFERAGIDTLEIARKVHKELPSKSLEALCAHYGICNAAAHRAYHDALATAKLYQILAHEFEEQVPNIFEPKPLLYKPKKIQPMTSKQKQFLEALAQYHHVSLPEHYETLSRSAASKTIDHIILQYGNRNSF